MAVSLPNVLARALAVAFALFAGAQFPAAAVAQSAPASRPAPESRNPAKGLAARNSQLPINLEAASSDFDYKNNKLLFKRVKITQGDLQVTAAEASASGLNFQNSDWRLLGEVQIVVPDGKLASDEANVTFRDNDIVKAVIKGAPATFEQKLKDSNQLAQGKATTIDYDVQASTVHLTGNAWLSDGQNEIRGDTLIYDIGRQRVMANPNAKEPGGVHITINPKSSSGGAPTQPQPPPPKDRTP